VSFGHRRGLRQGDPLSPLLFIIAIDSLHRILQRATDIGVLSPLPLREAKLRASLYADDAIVFMNPIKDELQSLLRILKAFGEATGLRINIDKCSISSIRCDDIDLDEVLAPFNGERVQLPIKYLGLPLFLGRLRFSHLQQILDRARAKLAGWRGKWINAGGRRTLSMSVLSTLPIFALTALKLPKRFFVAFNKIRRPFTWGAEENDLAGGKCKIAWSKVCSPLDRGGLGLPNLSLFGRALRLRWLWYEWTDPGRPWVGMPVPCDRTDRDLFAAATRVRIGDGTKASFWDSTWLADSPLRLSFPLLYAHSRRKWRTVAQSLTDNRWVADLRHNLTTAILEEFLQVWRLLRIANTVLQPGVPDTISWILTADGVYSAKSAYRVQFEGRTLTTFRCDVWGAWAPPKHKFFAWLLFQNRLWCADRLQQREWPNGYFCPLCRRNLETSQHLITECPFSREIWTTIATWPHCDGVLNAAHSATGSIATFREQWLEASPMIHRKGVSSLFLLTCWHIWRERNERTFRDKERSVQQVISFIKDEAQEWAFAGAKALRKLMFEPP
jgi:hypothetical protein